MKTLFTAAAAIALVVAAGPVSAQMYPYQPMNPPPMQTIAAARLRSGAAILFAAGLSATGLSPAGLFAAGLRAALLHFRVTVMDAG